MECSKWIKLKNNFKSIIDDTLVYSNIFREITLTTNNMLLYSVQGFPIDLFLDEILKVRFNIDTIYKNNSIWNKNIHYIENQYFFEINLMNPDIRKDFSFLTDFILHLIKSHNINNTKKIIIIKHIEYLKEYFFQFRILLERFSSNVIFLCTSHSISQIEQPIKSRFNLFRIPLFDYIDIVNIYEKYLNAPLPQFLILNKSRDLIKCIFFSDIEINDNSFIVYNFPPLYDFIKTFSIKDDNLLNIRTLSYKCCQYNISIIDLVKDFLKLIDETDFIQKKINKKISKKNLIKIKQEYKFKIINSGSHIDNMLCLTNKGREPIYIEAFLCDIFLMKQI